MSRCNSPAFEVEIALESAISLSSDRGFFLAASISGRTWV